MPIFDQGYQHWTGTLTGHTWRWLAITRHGVRLGMKNTFIRLLLLTAWLPAVALAGSLCVWGLVEQRSSLVQPLLSIVSSLLGPSVLADPKSFRVEVWTLCYEIFLMMELRFSMVLILMVGPSLISGDMRFNALPLYFSRPVRRIDYFVGKLGVIGVFLAMVLVLPSLLAYGLGLLFSLDFSIIRETFSLLLTCISWGAIVTLSAGLFILALSSLSRNSRYIALFWLGVWFVTSIVATVLETVNREQRMAKRYHATRTIQMNQSAQAKPKTFEEQQRYYAKMQEEQQKVFNEIEREELDAAKTDWRPLISYTGNLARVGQHMLGSDAAWRKIAENLPANMRDQFLMQHLGPQYPWYWSAGLLVGLMGISACILNFRVKSMDRLK
jgi:ABC-2 type transport system permease protein